MHHGADSPLNMAGPGVHDDAFRFYKCVRLMDRVRLLVHIPPISHTFLSLATPS